MSLITKIPGVIFTDSTLPKLYRDAAITSGTKFCFDAGDTYSFPAQATPAASSLWTDLTPNNSSATFGSAPAAFLNSGFNFNPAVNGLESIQLPMSGKPAANAAGFLFVIWLKYLAPTSSSYAGVAGYADSTSASVCAYALDTGAANGSTIRTTINGFTGSTQPMVVGNIYQIGGCAKKLANGTYDYYFYQNGVLINSINTGATALGVPIVTPNPFIGVFSGFSPGAGFRAFRCLYDDTSVLANQAAITAMVLADYNANNGRFS